MEIVRTEHPVEAGAQRNLAWAVVQEAAQEGEEAELARHSVCCFVSTLRFACLASGCYWPFEFGRSLASERVCGLETPLPSRRSLSSECWSFAQRDRES